MDLLLAIDWFTDQNNNQNYSLIDFARTCRWKPIKERCLLFLIWKVI